MDSCRLLLVRQHFPNRAIKDIPETIRQELSQARFSERLSPGARVAIGVGSRGIANISTIVKSIVAYWKHQGMNPFIFPAMGSHGAATAEGQAQVLAKYGICEDTVACPIISSLEVVSLGRTLEGIDTFMDKMAYESDGLMLVGRVKWHTDFEGTIESGLFKMMAIGLGKLTGAKTYHTHAYKMGMEKVILSVGRQVLSSKKVLGGLAILEGACQETAQLTAVSAEEMERREEELLTLVKSYRGRIPVKALDILVVNEIGKNISGAGMDTKVINRSGNGERNSWSFAPTIERIFVRDLSDLSCNNGIGVGLADMATDRLINKIDWEPTYINSLTASGLYASQAPMHFPSDRECMERLVATVGRLDTRKVTIGWIDNTLNLSLLALSENLLPEIQQNPNLEVLGEPHEIQFDPADNLPNLLGTTVNQ